jgi:hypothetical protein
MNESSVLFLCLDFCPPGSWRRFTIDRASHVSFLRFGTTTISPKYVLIEPYSFAIWNSNKVIVGIAAGVWGVNLAFLLTGEFTPARSSVNANECVLITGVVQVYNCFQLAGLLVSSISRFALYGRL